MMYREFSTDDKLWDIRYGDWRKKLDKPDRSIYFYLLVGTLTLSGLGLTFILCQRILLI
jgi:hypothetical protein